VRTVEPFIRADQFQFIKRQTEQLVNGYASVNDKKVLNALKSLVYDKVTTLLPNMSIEQQQLVEPIAKVEDSVKADNYLSTLKPYVIPFKKVTEQTVKKLFPKAKKLKLPSFIHDLDLQEISYLGWDDKGTNKKYMITLQSKGFIGLEGTFTPASKKGICTICNRHSQVGLFMSEIKGTVQGTYIRRGNYICQDNLKCNQHVTSLEKLEEFILLLKG
jgi:hypothetical protein